MEPIQLQITPDMLAVLGSICPGGRSMLSPLQPFRPSSIPADQKLVETGLLSPSGQVNAPYCDLLAYLAKVDVCVNLSWNRSGEQKNLGLYSCYTISPSNPNNPILIDTSDPDHTVFMSPYLRPNLETDLKCFLENGEGSKEQINITLTAEQAVVLAALMDMQRQVAALREKVATPVEALEPAVWDASTLVKAFQKDSMTNKALWVFTVAASTLTSANDLDPDGVIAAANGLVRSGLLEQPSPTEYTLSDTLLKVVERYTNVAASFWLSIYHSEDGNVELGDREQETIGFCAKDVNLIFSMDNGNFCIQTLSRKNISGKITEMIFPSELPAGQDKTVQSMAAPTFDKTVLSMAAPVIDKKAQTPPAPSPAIVIKAKPPTMAPRMVRNANPPARKKKITKKLVFGLVGLLVFACLLMGGGVLLLLMS